MEAPPPLDAQYLRRIRSRADELVRLSVSIRERVLRSRRELLRSQDDLHEEMRRLREELASLSEETEGTVTRVHGVVRTYQHAAKRVDLMRLGQRIDAWAPEKKLTRISLKMMLKE